jgi:CopG family nickel-responsive transcriptional regulator
LWHELQKGATMTLERFCVSIEENLLEDPDPLVENRKFPNRFQAIRFLISRSKTEDVWLNN